MLQKTLIFLFVYVILGCQAGKELHHFKQADNYYRLKIKECAFLSSSRYMSGYYDERAVDTYFGELARPDSANLSKKQQNMESIDSNGLTSQNLYENKKFVMFLSTNSDEVANQISTFAENEQTLELIARLANKETIAKNEELNNELTFLSQNFTHIMDAGSKYISEIDTTNTSDFSQKQLLAFINLIATSRGKTVGFNSLKEAESWFYDEF